MFFSRLRLSVAVLAAALIAITIVSRNVEAHAALERSEPAPDAVLDTAPESVQIWFTQELFRREGANTIDVFGPDGTEVSTADARVDDDDRTLLSVPLAENLPPGRYTVRWSSLSADDGHPAEEEFFFTIASEAVPAATEPITGTVTDTVTAEPPITATVPLTAERVPTDAMPVQTDETVTETASQEAATETVSPTEPAQPPTPTAEAAPAATQAAEPTPAESGGGLPCLGSIGLGLVLLAVGYIGQRRSAWRN